MVSACVIVSLVGGSSVLSLSGGRVSSLLLLDSEGRILIGMYIGSAAASG